MRVWGNYCGRLHSQCGHHGRHRSDPTKPYARKSRKFQSLERPAPAFSNGWKLETCIAPHRADRRRAAAEERRPARIQGADAPKNRAAAPRARFPASRYPFCHAILSGISKNIEISLDAYGVILQFHRQLCSRQTIQVVALRGTTGTGALPHQEEFP